MPHDLPAREFHKAEISIDVAIARHDREYTRLVGR